MGIGMSILYSLFVYLIGCVTAYFYLIRKAERMTYRIQMEYKRKVDEIKKREESNSNKKE